MGNGNKPKKHLPSEAIPTGLGSIRCHFASIIILQFCTISLNFIHQRCTCRFTYVASKFSLFWGTWVIMLGALLMDARTFLRLRYGNQNEEEI